MTMVVQKPRRHERYIDKHDADTNLEFPHLDTMDKQYMDSILTPAAFKALLASEHSFADLFTISDQSFDKVRILSMARDETISSVDHRSQLASQCAVYFFVMKQRMRYNQQVIADGVTDYNDLVNMSVSFHWNEIGKISGYSMYTRLTDPDSMGDAIVLAFYHARLRRVVLLKIPGPEFRIAGGRFIGKHGVVIPFEKACGWCGRAAEDLKKCPCKGPRYCDGECQLMHWKTTHRFECKAGMNKK